MRSLEKLGLENVTRLEAPAIPRRRLPRVALRTVPEFGRDTEESR